MYFASYYVLQLNWFNLPCQQVNHSKQKKTGYKMPNFGKTPIVKYPNIASVSSASGSLSVGYDPGEGTSKDPRYFTVHRRQMPKRVAKRQQPHIEAIIGM